MLERLDNRRLVFVTGKGGVGKSTFVGALGRAFAERGEQTLVVETDTYSAMEGLLGVDLADNSVTAVDPPLFAVNLDAPECVIDTIARFVPSRRVVRAILNNRVARVFFDTAPGVNEFAMLDQVRKYLERRDGDAPRWDRVIVDLPASGHAVTFLNVPETFRELFRVGSIADAAEDLADMTRDVENTAVVAVCLPEEMPVNETIELEDRLESTLGRGLTVAFANMVHREPLEPDQKLDLQQIVGSLDREKLLAETIRGTTEGEDRVVERVLAGNVLAMDWHDRDTRYLNELHDRLDAQVEEIPVYYETDGATVVDRVVDRLLDRDDPTDAHESLAS